MLHLQSVPRKTLQVAGKVVSLQGNKKPQYVICNGKSILVQNTGPLVISSQPTTSVSKPESLSVEDKTALKTTGDSNLASRITNNVKRVLAHNTAIDGKVTKKPKTCKQSSNELQVSSNKTLEHNYGTNFIPETLPPDSSCDNVIKEDKILPKQTSPEVLSHSVFSVTDSSSSSKTVLDFPVDDLSVMCSDFESDGSDEQTLDRRLPSLKSSSGTNKTGSTSKRPLKSVPKQDFMKRSIRLRNKKLAALQKKANSKVVGSQSTRMVTRSKSRKKYQ